MMLYTKNKISFSRADELIEKYYDGQTTCEEENRLRDFLRQKKLPEKYETEKAILGYFEKNAGKSTKTIVFSPFYKSVAAAAAIVFLIGFTVFKIMPENKNYAYVDGKKITNAEKIKSLASNSLNDVSEYKNIAEEQLSNFSNIEFK